MKNLYIKVQVTPEQSTAIQEAVFEQGGSWSAGETFVKYISYPFLTINGGILTFCSDEDSFYTNRSDLKQVFAREALELIEKCVAIKPAFVVDIRRGEIAVRENTLIQPKILDKDTPGLVCLWTFGEIICYNKKMDTTTLYGNELKDEILEKAYKQCDELNEVKR